MTSFAVGLTISLADIAALVGARDVAMELGSIATTPLSTFAGAIPVLLMLLVLMLRPAGLFGGQCQSNGRPPAGSVVCPNPSAS
jgi:branched-chain amino acid transport system permease protein